MAEVLAELRFRSCPTKLKEVRDELRDICSNEGFDDKRVQELLLVINEACANVMRHAYHDDASQPIELDVHRSEQMLEFRLRDYAEPIDPAKIKPRDLSETRPGGLGINIIDEIMDEWRFESPSDGGGNLLILRKQRPESE